MNFSGKRFPIQGTCEQKTDNCTLWFCGDKPKSQRPHERYGSVPWEIGMIAFKVWNKSYGRCKEGSPEYLEAKGIANRGGFGHCEMDEYTGSHDWFKHFEASK